jgi:hypothetical protein
MATFAHQSAAIRGRAMTKYIRSRRPILRDVARRIEQDERLDNAQLTATIPALQFPFSNTVVGFCNRIVKLMNPQTLDVKESIKEFTRGTCLDVMMDGVTSGTQLLMELFDSVLRNHCPATFSQFATNVGQFACKHPMIFTSLVGMILRVLGGVAVDLWNNKLICLSEHTFFSAVQGIVGSVTAAFSSGVFAAIVATVGVTWLLNRLRVSLERERPSTGTLSFGAIFAAMYEGVKDAVVSVFSPRRTQQGPYPAIRDDLDDLNVPDTMCCSICCRILTDCSFLGGNPYHLQCISKWLDCRAMDPMSRVPATTDDIIHCPEMEDVVRRFLEEQGVRPA